MHLVITLKISCDSEYTKSVRIISYEQKTIILVQDMQIFLFMKFFDFILICEFFKFLHIGSLAKQYSLIFFSLSSVLNRLLACPLRNLVRVRFTLRTQVRRGPELCRDLLPFLLTKYKKDHLIHHSIQGGQERLFYRYAAF